jgi:hypothetical protein
MRFVSRKIDVLVDLRREVVEELLQLGEQGRREVPLDAPDPVPAGGQPGAAQLVEPVQQNLTVAEAVEEHGHRADVERLGPQPELMADDALHLRHDGAQILGSVRHRG